MSSAGEVGDAPAVASKSRGVLGLVVVVPFALLYAYDVWEAIANLVALPAFYDAYGLGAANIPWWLLWAGVLIPIAAFAIALVAGRGRAVFAQALVLVVGLAITAGLSISVLAVEEVLRPVIAVIG